MPILLPAERIFLDVPPELQEGVLASDDLIKKPRLPVEISLPTGPNAAGAGAFEMSNGLSQRCRPSIETRRLEREDPVKMIGHHDPGIEIHVGPAPGHLHPFLGDDLPEIGKVHLALCDLAEPTDPALGADRHTIDATPTVIPARQPGRRNPEPVPVQDIAHTSALSPMFRGNATHQGTRPGVCGQKAPYVPIGVARSGGHQPTPHCRDAPWGVSAAATFPQTSRMVRRARGGYGQDPRPVRSDRRLWWIGTSVPIRRRPTGRLYSGGDRLR